MRRGALQEQGGLFSHGATLAREHGVPAVTNIPGISQILRDGETIEVDGSRGVVRVAKRRLNDRLGDPAAS